MADSDLILLGIVAVVGLVCAVLRGTLAEKQGRPLSLFWKIQGFVFPALLLIALGLVLLGGPDLVFPAVVLGLLEELVLGFIRRRTQTPQSGD